MKTQQPKAADTSSATVVNRRALLTGSAIAAAAASGVALIEPAEAFNATREQTAPRYKESEHVKTFYRLAGR